MAITVLSQPQAYMPCYNVHEWVASSTQTAQPNFKYYITCTDLITSTSKNFAVDTAPTTNYLYFNSSTFAENYMSLLNPDGLYGFQKNTGSIRKIRVNIGEQYDVAGVSTIFTGTNIDYIVWNGVYEFLNFPAFNYTNNLYSQSNNIQLLTNNKQTGYTFNGSINYSNNTITFENKRHYLSFLSSAAGDVETLLIKFYNASGTNIGNWGVTNPYNGGTTYTDKYVFIDVGYLGILNMPGAQISTSTFNIANIGQVAYYVIYDYSTWCNSQLRPLIRIDVDCEPRYDIWTLHYLGNLGQWETVHCSKLSLKNSTKTTSEFKQNPFYLNGSNQYTYDRGSMVNKTLNVEVTDTIQMNTDWLEDWQVSALKECYSSPVIYMDDGTGLIPVKVTTNSYKEQQKYNSQLRSVTFDIQYTHTNNKQRG